MTEVVRVEVVEYTDPWCSWAWGTEPKLRKLQWQYGDRLGWRRVMGDLVAPRPATETTKVAEAAARLAGYWRRVYEHTGMSWPTRLQWPPSCSAVAARAVKAAERQGDEAARLLLRALRESCFVFSRPADTADRILALATTVDGIDASRLAADLESADVEGAFQRDRAETRQPNEYVRTLAETHEGAGNAKPDGDGWRYVFPTLLFRGEGGEHTVPGWQPWERYVEAMEAAESGSTSGPRPGPTAEEALARWRLLTERELQFLCGPAAVPPEGSTAFDWGGGRAWLAPGIEPRN